MKNKEVDYKKILDSMMGGLYVYDVENQKNIFINKAYTDITGWEIHELDEMGADFIDLFHDDDKENLLAHIAAITSSSKDTSHTLEYRFKTKNDEWVWCLSYDTPFERDNEGKVTKFVGSFIDITKRKKYEKKLQENEERFRGLFETSPVGIALVSPEGKWIKVNPAICDLVGYTEEELRNLTFQDITHPDDLEKDLSQVNDMLEGKIDTYRMEKRYFHKNGDTIWVLLGVSIVRDQKNKPLYFVSQVVDIDLVKRAEMKIQEKVEELESLNSFLVGRELKMTELKEEIESLRGEGGKKNE